MTKRLHLFEAYGVELEYMIVDQNTLDIQPIAEVLLKNEAGEIQGELERGMTAWSNELVSHVVEMKSNGPSADLTALRDQLVLDVAAANALLAGKGAMLLPSAAHPWMNPAKETKLWEHESQEIYHLYDKIFSCKGHGWSNLQSTHINLPFYDDEEFTRLHTAIRFMMPMIPALTAASPVLDGKFTGYLDKRLYYYEKNQSKIPILTGKVIPERLFTKHAYQKHVYDRIAAAIKPFDPDNILKPVWLNSRGAMARFDRGAIEIRIIDIQECPSADIALVALVTEIVKLLVKGKVVSFDLQEAFETDDLHAIFRQCVKNGSKSLISDPAYATAWGFDQSFEGKEFWKKMIELVSPNPQMQEWNGILKSINDKGTLAERIVESIGEDYTQSNLRSVYMRLAVCLQEDRLFNV
ncbi:MAG: glutamate-cysteine ligase family protein [Marinoscillum sp.]